MAEVRGFKDARERARFALFAIPPSGTMKEGWVNLHLLIWKQLIAAIVRVELEDEAFKISSVWAPAWLRFERKALALSERVAAERRRAESRGEEPHDASKRGISMAPLAEFTEEGQ